MRKGLVSLGLGVLLLIGARWPPPFSRAGANTIWSIGVQDDNNAEFSGTPNASFSVGSSTTSQFPPNLVGKGTHEDIQFNLGTVSPSYLTVLASRSAPNTGSGLQPIVNGHYLTPRWASTWQYNRTWLPWTYDPSKLDVNQGVIWMRWAIPPEDLRVGLNTITLRVVNTDFGDAATPSFDFDYVSLERGTTNLARPRRYVGTTDYWTNDAMMAQIKRNDFDSGGDGRVWLSYLFNQNTLDADLETLEKLGVKASYPDLTWNLLEPARGVWNDEVFNYYHYTFQQLNSRGVRVVAKIQYTPRWASSTPAAGDYDRYPPANEQDWIDFLAEVGRRLGDVVDWWAIMNEVDSGSFWQGTMSQYYSMMRDAYDTLKAADRVDADGDGVSANVVPSSSGESTAQSYWQSMYAAVFPRMDAFHAHEYRWGIETGIEKIGSIDSNLPVIISEYGPAWWFTDETKVREYYPFAAMSMTGYVLRNPTSPVNMVMNWLFKGDPDRNGGPWPDPTEWYHPSSNDQFSHDDGNPDDANSSIANYEPTRGGPPFVNLSLHSAGAYYQHQMWLQNLEGDQYPVEVVSPAGTGQIEVSAVNLGTSIDVLASNFEGGINPVTRTITLKLTTPWPNNKLDVYSADNYVYTEHQSGPHIQKSLDVAMGMARVVVSNAGGSVDAPPGLDITSPGVPSATSSIVVPSAQYFIRADARDDVGVARVEYRVDPINNPSYVTLSPAGATYEAMWDATGVTGIHTVEVRATDSAGQTKTRSRVVKVGDPSHVHVLQVYSSTAAGDPRVSSLEAGVPAHWGVQLVDGTQSGYGLAGAIVGLEIRRLGEAPVGTYTSTVDTSGRASFSVPGSSTSSPGLYTARVTSVTAPAGKTYDSSANIVAEASIRVETIYRIFVPLAIIPEPL